MTNATETIEGWYCFVDFRQIDWKGWKKLQEEDREEALSEMSNLLAQWEDNQVKEEGSYGLFQILGHKADVMFMFLRPSLDELIQIEESINKTKIAEFTKQTSSYVSVIELSNYIPKGQDPYSIPEVINRLYPQIPKNNYICFYPMNKKREVNANWYMLTKDTRSKMMRSHSLIGRKYAGKVKQFILGSVGFDDYEWGVALFSEDPLYFKKLIYEMRFDEVSAKYSEFGSFYIGKYLTQSHFNRLLQQG